MKEVQDFYNKTPFPDYELDNFDTKERLKYSANEFVKLLDRSIPEGASIIDVGTGTGQLSAFLSLRRKNVLGIDFSDSSLNKAKSLKEKLKLNSWHLKKVDIMDIEQINKIEKFDCLLCLGVLHHTEDAYQAFKNILTLVKPGGLIAIGLYNRFGRLPLKRRIFMAKTIYKDNQDKKDKYIKMQIGEVTDKEKARGWWNDQYLHPHETTHTIGEVLRWFMKNKVKYCHTMPSCHMFKKPEFEVTGFWDKLDYPYFSKLFHQLYWIFKTNKEGGYWITFGKKNE